MSLHVDLSWILEVAERAGQRDPAPDDLGVPLSAVARHRAELLEQPVYGGPYARAAALVHTLGRCRWLERSNLTVGCSSQGRVLPSAFDILTRKAQPMGRHRRSARVVAGPDHGAGTADTHQAAGRWASRLMPGTGIQSSG
jgi:hypothetical protein